MTVLKLAVEMLLLAGAWRVSTPPMRRARTLATCGLVLAALLVALSTAAMQP